MRSSIPAFIAATLLLVITMTSKTISPVISTGNFDSEIKLSSLANAAPLLEPQPMLPVIGVADNKTIKNQSADSKPINIGNDSNLAAASINAAAATIAIINGNENIFAYHENIRWPLASLTKIMTAVVALEKIGAQKLATFTDNDVLSVGDAGSFKSGETFSVRDLVTAMLTASSNDAADALARFYGAKNFIDAMQQKDAEIDMSETTFFDPTGLTALNQSTAADLQKLIAYVLKKHPEILDISHQKENSITETKSDATRTLKNINKFAGLSYFLGGKTGYTDEAGGNLISLFDISGNKILIIVLGTDNRFGETEKLYNWVRNVLK